MVGMSATVKNLPGRPAHSSMVPGEFQPGTQLQQLQGEWLSNEQHGKAPS